ncbi:MAG: LamG domain-containing protein, partial [Bacteroidota bacterium]|nr:LamG domain-containing protein [Bacteroidota bacterium]
MKLNRLLILFAVISMFTSNVLAQYCISENFVRTAWSYIPYFNGNSAYLYMNKSGGYYDEYFDSDFSFDMWIKTGWAYTSSDLHYLFTAGSIIGGGGYYDSNYEGLEISLVNDSDNWKIRAVNSRAYFTQTFYYDINDSDLFSQWNHIAFTYDASNRELVVYFNGAQKGSHSFVSPFDIQYEDEGFRMGDARHTYYDYYYNQHFKGHISGFRLWNSSLSSAEISYIWDRTFHQEGTFESSNQYLYDKMVANMYTEPYDVYSLKSGFSIWETGIYRSTYFRHPACPPKIYNLTLNDDYCDEIHLDWDVGTGSATNYVYRKEVSSGSWTLVCRTNSSYYHDNNVERDIEYEYKIVSAWRVDAHTAHSNTLRFSPDFETINGQVRGIVGPNNLTIEEDVNINSNCNGVVMIKWDPVNTTTYPYFSNYSVECSIAGGTWQNLISGTTQTSYTHNVNSADYGKSIEYRVMADGDNCSGTSNVVSGIANEICTTAPTAVTAIDNNGSIDLQWTYTQVGAPAAHFRIYRNEDGGNYDLLEEDIPVEQTTWTDHDAAMCIDYQYKVEAYNHCGASGSLSSSSNSVTLLSDFSDVFTYMDGTEEKSDFDASKGYYSNKILLEWSVNPYRQGSINEYEIFRRKENQSFTLLTSIENSESTYYEDNSNNPNILYEYLIYAKSYCGSVEEVSDSLFTTGFRSTSGIVSGKVSFAGGNAVEDVEVIVESEEVNLSNSLHFDGNQYLGGMIPSADVLQNGFTVETWIKPEDMDGGYIHGVVSLNSGMMHLGVKNMKPYATLLADPMTIEPHVPLMMLEPDSVLNQDEWCHLALSYNTLTGETNMYLNGEFIAQSQVDTADQWEPDVPEVDLIVGRVYDTSSYFKGNIDELRLWQGVKSDEEISQDYKRIITGSEEGIYGYYRFDEGFGYSAYDVSKNGAEFNKNDLDLITDSIIFPDWSTEIPSPEQLRPSGVTDQNGNYSVRGIAYSDGGNIFTVTPYKPLHDFDPMNVELFIGDNAPVHNNIDFIDQSAFTFSGIAYFSGTNYPVGEANVYIDNQQQFDIGGYPVQTNENGQFDISVPIGQHFVTVKKDGHVFEHNGQWPHPTEAVEYPTFNFQSDVSLQTFYDNTKVVLTGRFVGGDVEGNKKLGFNASKNNIGQGTIVFKNEIGYDINADPAITSSRIEIQTDSASGEYVIQMIPGVLKIDSVSNADYEMDNLDLGVIDMSEIPELQTESDTIYYESIVDGDTVMMQEINHFSYHYKRNFIYYNEPTILLSGEDNEPLIGETEYIYKHQDSEDVDTIDLMNNSPFAYPVFVMGNSYPMQIKVQAIYENNDTGTPVYDTVPVEGADVTILNNLEISEPAYQLTTDFNGIVSDYPGFRVGLPNMNMNTADQTSFTKTMTITAQAGNFSIAWNGGDVYRAYVLGGIDAGGSNYVTYGPEIPQFILRDPPGDRSYTMLEQGSSFSASRNYSFNLGGTSDYDNVLMRGVKFELGGGLAGPVFTSEVQSDINVGISTTSWVDDSGAFMETYEFNQTYSTSADPNGVGSMADVYIGSSKNLFFTETENLRIYPKDYCTNSGLDYLGDDELADTTAGFSIGKRAGFAVTDDPSSTFFIYSQDHILNSLLPTYRDLIYNLLSSADYESHLP